MSDIRISLSLDPAFVAWYEQVGTIQAVMTLLAAIVVSLPLIFFFLGICNGLFHHRDSNDIGNSDTDGML